MQEPINILYLFPGPTYRPDLPDFKDRFIFLSDFSTGEIYSWTWDEQSERATLGNFQFRGFSRKKNPFAFKMKYIFFILRNVFKNSSGKKFDVILCYDPMLTGILGCILKLFMRTKLIIEVNNLNFKESLIFHYGNRFKTKFKIFLSLIIQRIVYSYCDHIRILTEAQKKSLEIQKWENKISTFHDFVPTHYFENGNKPSEKYILFVGFPYYLKGVDILIKAFESISKKYPNFKLKVIGHKLQGYVETFIHKNDNISVHGGMFYNHLKNEFEKCYCLVLPSRTEGMGRVLLEAMSCAKPVIGTRVGGIPYLIQDGINGYLINSEDIDDLAVKLDMLLSDQEKAEEMGKEGLKIVNEKYSSKKYAEYFKKMLIEVLE